MNLLGAATTILVAGITIISGTSLTRPKRLRSTIAADINIYKNLPESAVKQSLLATIEGRTRQLCSEGGDLALSNRQSVLAIWGAVAAVSLLLLWATVVNVVSASPDIAWMPWPPVVFFIVVISMLLFVVSRRTAIRLRAAYHGQSEPGFFVLSQESASAWIRLNILPRLRTPRPGRRF